MKPVRSHGLTRLQWLGLSIAAYAAFDFTLAAAGRVEIPPLLRGPGVVFHFIGVLVGLEVVVSSWLIDRDAVRLRRLALATLAYVGLLCVVYTWISQSTKSEVAAAALRELMSGGVQQLPANFAECAGRGGKLDAEVFEGTGILLTYVVAMRCDALSQYVRVRGGTARGWQYRAVTPRRADAGLTEGRT